MPFNRDPVIVLSAGFALLSAQKPDQARSVLLHHSLGPCAVPPIPAVHILRTIRRRLGVCWSALATALGLQDVLSRAGALLSHWPFRAFLRPPGGVIEPPVDLRTAIAPDPHADLIACLDEFDEFDDEDFNNDMGAHWVPHAPTKGGKVMTGSA